MGTFNLILESGASEPMLKIELNDLDELLRDETYYEKFANELYKTVEKLYEQTTVTKNKHRKRLIEPEIKKLIRRPSVRLQMLQKCGDRAFLLPNAKPYPKFPVMAPVVNKDGEVEKCEYHCGLIVAAWYRANEWKHKHPEYEKVAQEAYKLYKKLGCEKHVPIHIHAETEVITPDDARKFQSLYETFTYIFDLLIPTHLKNKK
jgi:hypothetical protein